MHPVPNLIAIYAFIVMGVGYFITIYRIIGKEDGLWGKPSINPFLFNSGKIARFICWGLALLKAIFPFFGWVVVPLWMSWTGSCMLCIATVVLLLSFYGLGSSLRYGLPEKETQLKTSGRSIHFPLLFAFLNPGLINGLFGGQANVNKG